MRRILLRSDLSTVACALLLALTLAPVAARADDGVTEINQAKAVAGGVTPGDAPGFPVTLTSGSYRLTSELEGTPGENGIEISGDVTLDLNGFRLYRTLIGFSGHGIRVLSSTTGARIMNGTIEGFYGNGIQVEVLASDDYPVRLEHLNVMNHGFYGVIVANGTAPAGSNVVIENCRVSNNNADGIDGADVVRDSRVERNGGLGIDAVVVERSVVRVNGGAGIQGADVVDDSQVLNNTGLGISAGRVTNSLVRSNGGGGIVATSAVGNTLYYNSGTGIKARDVRENRLDVSSADIGVEVVQNTFGNLVQENSFELALGGIAIQVSGCAYSDIRGNSIGGAGTAVKLEVPATACTGYPVLIESNVIHNAPVGIYVNVQQMTTLYLNNRFGSVSTPVNIVSGGAYVTDGGGNIIY